MATQTVVAQEKGGRLVTAGSARGRKSTTSTQSKISQEEVTRLEGTVRNLHKGIVTSSFQIGAILVTLRENVIPAGQWRSYLKGSQERFGFSERTAYRYVQGYEDAANLPSTKIEALEKVGLDPAAPKVLAAIQEVAEKEGGKMKPQRFANAVQTVVQEHRRPKVESIEKGDGFRRQRRQTQLYEFASRLYEGADPSTIERDFSAVAQRLIRDLQQEMKSRLLAQRKRVA